MLYIPRTQIRNFGQPLPEQLRRGTGLDIPVHLWMVKYSYHQDTFYTTVPITDGEIPLLFSFQLSPSISSEITEWHNAMSRKKSWVFWNSKQNPWMQFSLQVVWRSSSAEQSALKKLPCCCFEYHSPAFDRRNESGRRQVGCPKNRLIS